MKREETVYICERCSGDIRVPARKFLGFRQSGKMPRDWKDLTSPEGEGLMVCQTCLDEAKKSWTEYMRSVTLSEKTK